MTKHTPAIYDIPPSIGGRRWLDTTVCHARGFSKVFWQLRWHLQMAESCSPCFSPHHAATSACNAEATSRCWILACLLSFPFYFKNSIWVACSQGCYSAPQRPQQWQKTNQAASAGFTRILCYLVFPSAILILFVFNLFFT